MDKPTREKQPLPTEIVKEIRTMEAGFKSNRFASTDKNVIAFLKNVSVKESWNPFGIFQQSTQDPLCKKTVKELKEIRDEGQRLRAYIEQYGEIEESAEDLLEDFILIDPGNDPTPDINDFIPVNDSTIKIDILLPKLNTLKSDLFERGKEKDTAHADCETYINILKEAKSLIQTQAKTVVILSLNTESNTSIRAIPIEKDFRITANYQQIKYKPLNLEGYYCKPELFFDFLENEFLKENQPQASSGSSFGW